jgi:drug/metabolite transporter (DMT)-like permease
MMVSMNAVPSSAMLTPAMRGRLLLLAAAVLWSTSGLLVKSPPLAAIAESYRGPVLACYRALFAAACLLPFLRPRHVRWRPMLVPMVLGFALMNLLFVTAMTRTTAAAAIFLQYTSTVWAFLFGLLFLGERISRGNAVALAAAVCGIAWIVRADWGGENSTGNVIALGSGFAYAGVIVSLRSLREEAPAWLVALNHAVAGLILLPWVLPLNVSLTPQQWSLTALLGIGQMALPYLLFTRGVRWVTTQEAALLTLLEPVLNPLWVWLCWGETVPLSTWIGGSLILGGLAVRYTFFPEGRT